MRCKTIIIAFLLILSFAGSRSGFCNDHKALIIATDEFPPYSFCQDGKLKGIAVDIVKRLMDKTDCPGKISLLPWKRALNYSKTHAIMLFPFSKVPHREKDYKWIGPIMIDSFVFAVRSSDKRLFNTLDDFRHVQVGANRATPTSQRLKDLYFHNIQVTAAEKLNAKKLIHGNRIDAWYCSHLILRYTLKKEGLDEKLIRIEYKDMDVEMYIGASSGVSDAIVERWQVNFKEMKETGEYQEILYKSIAEWKGI